MTIQRVDYPVFGTMTPRRLDVISDFIVHHTAGPFTQTPLDIDQEHRDIGDAGIAYNWLIDYKGTVYEGRPVNIVPAAAFGRNTQSVNVSCIGNFERADGGFNGPPSPAMIDALEKLCLWAHKQYPTIIRTIGHRDVATMFYPTNTGPYATACPGSELYALIPQVRAYVASVLRKL